MENKRRRPPFWMVLLQILIWLIAILLLIAAAFYVIPLTEHADDAKTDGSESWMAGLSDDLYLSEITIPGTHDSATKYVQLAFFSKCQSKTIGEQLQSGYRYLDIRLGADGDLLKLMHGFTSCKIGALPWSQTRYLEDVLSDCYAFLDANPTETILFAVKQEHGDETAAEFESLLKAYIDRNPDRWLLTDHIPTLGESRGKLVLLRRWEGNLGVPLLWEDQGGHDDVSLNTVSSEQGSYTLWVQDRFCYGTDDKWTAFENGIAGSETGANSAAIQFLSTKGTLAYGHPYAFAKKLNPWLMKMILPSDAGWIVVDFASAPLAEHIYSTNF